VEAREFHIGPALSRLLVKNCDRGLVSDGVRTGSCADMAEIRLSNYFQVLPAREESWTCC
jgi:hypothetical protein